MIQRVVRAIRARPVVGLIAIVFLGYLGSLVALCFGVEDAPIWGLVLAVPMGVLYGLFLVRGGDPPPEVGRRPGQSGRDYGVPWAGVPRWKKPLVFASVLWKGCYYFFFGVYPDGHDKH